VTPTVVRGTILVAIIRRPEIFVGEPSSGVAADIEVNPPVVVPRAMTTRS
jgi:hypothetical protein